MASETNLYPDEKIELSAEQRGRWIRIGFAMAILFVGAAAIFGAIEDDGMSRFMHAYMLGFTYVLSIALGALFFVLIQHILRSKWSVTVRRMAENMTCVFPYLLIASLPILITTMIGSDVLYVWLHEHANKDHVIHGKASWLNGGFFSIRIVIYLLAATALSRYFRQKSLAQDETKDPHVTEHLRKWSALGIILFAFIITLGAMDLLMSFAPKWFSTIFGVYYFAGANVALLASLSLMSLAVQRGGRLTKSVTVEHYHDLGKILFGFVFFWSYIAFSQYMLIWYAAIPEETEWYHLRSHGGWGWVSVVLIFGHFAFPFLCLLSRNTKRRLQVFAFFCVWLLVMHAVDLFWVIMPQYGSEFIAHTIPGRQKPVYELVMQHSFKFHIVDLLALIGFIGLFIGATARASKGRLLAIGDPRLVASQKFENF